VPGPATTAALTPAALIPAALAPAAAAPAAGDQLVLVTVVAGAVVVVALAALAVVVVLTRRWADRQRAELDRLRSGLAVAEEGRGEAVHQLARLAHADPVTGLVHGSCLAEAVAVAVAQGRAVALLHLGLDGFRRFNALHGRGPGDAVLSEVAHRLRRAVRAEDVPARWGGDEFVVLLDEEAAAVDVAVRLLAALAEPYEVGGGGRATLTVSIGVAHAASATGPEAPGLLAAAEQAVGEAKGAGGGCVRVWDPSAALAHRAEARAAERLRQGLADELEVHYQPVVDLDSGIVSGVECLVRWRREDRLVPPDEFIGLAERHGLVAELGLRVLATAVRDAPALAAAAGHDLVVAVNVSAHQLRDPRLLPAVREAVRALGSTRLVLEMTESVLVAEDSLTQQALDDLVAAGAFLTVDDFGTGYATLAYLRRRPFSAFKIDRSYVRDIETDKRTRDLVEGLVLLAVATGMGLVAEGVETAGQAELLRRTGAPTQQGYLHARPEPLAEAVLTIGRLRERLAAGTTVV